MATLAELIDRGEKMTEKLIRDDDDYLFGILQNHLQLEAWFNKIHENYKRFFQKYSTSTKAEYMTVCFDYVTSFEIVHMQGEGKLEYLYYLSKSNSEENSGNAKKILNTLKQGDKRFHEVRNTHKFKHGQLEDHTALLKAAQDCDKQLSTRVGGLASTSPAKSPSPVPLSTAAVASASATTTTTSSPVVSPAVSVPSPKSSASVAVPTATATPVSPTATATSSPAASVTSSKSPASVAVSTAKPVSPTLTATSSPVVWPAVSVPPAESPVSVAVPTAAATPASVTTTATPSPVVSVSPPISPASAATTARSAPAVLPVTPVPAPQPLVARPAIVMTPAVTVAPASTATLPPDKKMDKKAALARYDYEKMISHARDQYDAIIAAAKNRNKLDASIAEWKAPLEYLYQLCKQKAVEGVTNYLSDPNILEKLTHDTWSALLIASAENDKHATKLLERLGKNLNLNSKFAGSHALLERNLDAYINPREALIQAMSKGYSQVPDLSRFEKRAAVVAPVANHNQQPSSGPASPVLSAVTPDVVLPPVEVVEADRQSPSLVGVSPLQASPVELEIDAELADQIILYGCARTGVDWTPAGLMHEDRNVINDLQSILDDCDVVEGRLIIDKKTDNLKINFKSQAALDFFINNVESFNQKVSDFKDKFSQIITELSVAEGPQRQHELYDLFSGLRAQYNRLDLDKYQKFRTLNPNFVPKDDGVKPMVDELQNYFSRLSIDVDMQRQVHVEDEDVKRLHNWKNKILLGRDEFESRLASASSRSKFIQDQNGLVRSLLSGLDALAGKYSDNELMQQVIDEIHVRLSEWRNKIYDQLMSGHTSAPDTAASAGSYGQIQSELSQRKHKLASEVSDLKDRIAQTRENIKSRENSHGNVQSVTERVKEFGASIIQKRADVAMQEEKIIRAIMETLNENELALGDIEDSMPEEGEVVDLSARFGLNNELNDVEELNGKIQELIARSAATPDVKKSWQNQLDAHVAKVAELRDQLDKYEDPTNFDSPSFQ